MIRLPLLALLLVTLLMAAAPGTTTAAYDGPTTGTLEYGYTADYSPVQLGIVGHYQLFSATTPIRGLRLGLLSTSNRESDGLAISSIATTFVGHRGVSVAGLWHGWPTTPEPDDIGRIPVEPAVRRPSHGLFLAGITNVMRTPLTGLRVAGLVNAGRDLTGAEASLLVNDADAIRGVQLVGAVNIAERLHGVQIAGIYNYLGNDASRGLQLATVMNHTDASLTGVAVAGISNWHRAPTRGAMVSLFNLTPKMHGIQIGLMNDATELHGIQLGLFNFENGRMRLPLINAAGVW